MIANIFAENIHDHILSVKKIDKHYINDEWQVIVKNNRWLNFASKEMVNI